MKRISLFLLIAMITAPLWAQEEDKFQITPSADFVSSYVWRGEYQSGVAVQPSLTASWKGLSLTAWGTSDFSTVAKEIDFTLAYETAGFLIAVTDYWWGDEGIRFGNYSANHYLEGTAGYYFGEKVPLTLMWNTMFGMDGDKDEEGKRYYSSYIEATYDFTVRGVYLTAGIGVSPWTGIYHREGTQGFVLSSISLRATKEIKISDSFVLPVFTELTFAPNQDNVFLVFGLTI